MSGSKQEKKNDRIVQVIVAAIGLGGTIITVLCGLIMYIDQRAINFQATQDAQYTHSVLTNTAVALAGNNTATANVQMALDTQATQTASAEAAIRNANETATAVAQIATQQHLDTQATQTASAETAILNANDTATAVAQIATQQLLDTQATQTATAAMVLSYTPTSTPQPMRIVDVNDGIVIIEGGNVDQYTRGQSLIIYDTGVVDPVSSQVVEYPIALVHIAGGSRGVISAYVVIELCDNPVEARTNMRVDDNVDAIIDPLRFCPADESIVASTLTQPDTILIYRPELVQEGVVLEVVDPLIEGGITLDYRSIGVYLQVDDIFTRGNAAAVLMLNNAPFPPPGSLLVLSVSDPSPTPPLPTLTPTPTAPPQIEFDYGGASLSIDSVQVLRPVTYTEAEVYCVGRGARLATVEEWTAAVEAGAIQSPDRLWEWTSSSTQTGYHTVGHYNNGQVIDATSVTDDGGDMAGIVGFRCVTP